MNHPRPFRLATFASSAVLLAALSGTAWAADAGDEARLKELESKLERSLQLIEALQKKVSQLENAATGNAAAGGQSAPAVQEAKIEALQQQVAQLGTGLSSRGDSAGLPVHGFADVGLIRSGQDNPTDGKGRSGFNVGTMDLYLTPQFGDRVKTLLELVFEVDESGGLATDLERAQMGYTFSDAATAWVGRFHTPYGVWNTAYHHGAQIQTSITRPRFLDFEDKGGILPAHTTGAWLTGAVPAGNGHVAYDAYFGNAPGVDKEDGEARGALNMRMAGLPHYASTVGGNLRYEFAGAAEGLTLGVHAIRSKVTVDEDTNSRSKMLAFGGFGIYDTDNWEILGEYYRFNDRDESGGPRHTSTAWYTQIGYRVGEFTPYARYEKTSLDQSDSYFANQESGRSYRRTSLGVRYDLNPKAALKAEINRTTNQDLGAGVSDDRFSEARLQYSVRF
ncbi:outer membrane beta-barrel protein [Azoarcus sp. KH32C]|uniref:outer membrane beta-barrel protein n=1 Tax=Azoarcus sp. KH32C TaxID=748247 RepID=UPI0002385C25|nr:outer membrane beta-barrel protein [Azoarcus sp. KH32C]BAL26864.1 hypothetical protein AZKH_4591 [Azoarcus sp. KH32C]